MAQLVHRDPLVQMAPPALPAQTRPSPVPKGPRVLLVHRVFPARIPLSLDRKDHRGLPALTVLRGQLVLREQTRRFLGPRGLRDLRERMVSKDLLGLQVRTRLCPDPQARRALRDHRDFRVRLEPTRQFPDHRGRKVRKASRGQRVLRARRATLVGSPTQLLRSRT